MAEPAPVFVYRTLKNKILLKHYYLPGDLENQITEFVEHYNNLRYHDSLDNITPADVYFGCGQEILNLRERIRAKTTQKRRLQHQINAA